MLHIKYKTIGQLVLEMKSFEDFNHIRHVTWTVGTYEE